MHPYIFEKFKNIPTYLINYKSICFTYGIDVWGNYGKFRSTNLKNADQVLSVSKYTTLRLISNYPDLKIKTIHLGIDTSIINNTNNICKNSFEILTVGRLSSTERYTGHDLVIHAIKLLMDKKIHVKYNIVGDGDDIARLKNLCNQINVQDRVNFYGYIDDNEISNIYKKSSVFVMPSTVIERKNAIWGGEGLGLVYLEAGLYKLPVIASNLGGQTDCIINNVTGYLIDPTPENIASKIEILFKSKQIRESMGCAAEKFILEKFTSKNFSNNLLSIIKEI
jgi:phosphatidylinositol alpha-1,6-mannosyltransferase